MSYVAHVTANVQVAEWALADRTPVKRGLLRRVLFNLSLTYPSRTYAALGPSLPVFKIAPPVATLLASPTTHTGSHVRPACREALYNLGACMHATWARQLTESAAWLEGRHVELLDRRFGGELTRADIVGAEAADEEDPDAAAIARRGSTVAGSVAGEGGARSVQGGPSLSFESSRGSRYSSRANIESVKRRIRPQKLPPVDMQNPLFDIRHAEAEDLRAGRSLKV
jgi:hypothetical protein